MSWLRKRVQCLVSSLLGRLVGDQRVGARLARPLHDLEDEVLARNDVAAEARPRIAHVFVHRVQSLPPVDDVDRNAEMRAGAQEQPLPVADMRGEQQHGLAGVRVVTDEFRILHHDAPPEFLRAGAIAPQRLDQPVAQVAVHLPRRSRWRSAGALVRKRARDVFLHALAPPAHDAERDEVHEPAPRIDHRQRKVRQRLEQEFHSCVAVDRSCVVRRTAASRISTCGGSTASPRDSREFRPRARAHSAR